MRILTLCGSLRSKSSNRAVLRAFARLLPPEVVVEHYEGVGSLPHFNPDLDRDNHSPIEAVSILRGAMAQADGVVICTPEYAHGLPGSFKNVLDWLVSDPAFAGKHVVILHISRGSTWALDSLREVLRTMSAQIVEAASIALPLGSNQTDEAAILSQVEWRATLLQSGEALWRVLQERPDASFEPTAPSGL